VRKIWALVIGIVAESAIWCLMAYILSPFLPKFRVDRECIGELMKFARGMFGLPILTCIGFYADVFVLGKVVSDDMLGMYYLASGLVQYPILLFSRMISPVLLPAFSQKQDNRDSLCRGVLRVTRWSALICVPMVAFMASCAGGILTVVYGAKYAIAAIPCAILCLRIITRVEGQVLASLYLSVGKPQLHRKFVILRAAIIVVFIYPASVCFGLSGAATVVIAANLLSLLFQVFWCRRIIDLAFKSYLSCYVPGLLISVTPIALIILLRLLGIGSDLDILTIGTVVFAVSFGVGLLALNNKKNVCSA